MDADEPAVSKADHYQHEDGTIEVVYAREGDAVLTFREYRSVEAFEAEIDGAEYLGEHEGVATLPDAPDDDDDDDDV